MLRRRVIPKSALVAMFISKSKSKYLLKAYNKRIRTVQCGYMQTESITKNLNRTVTVTVRTLSHVDYF